MTDDKSQKQDLEILPEEETNLPEPQKKLKKTKEELKKCEEERKEYLAGWQRAKADFINYKKEEEKRFARVLNFASAEFIRDILPVLDSFELALSHGSAPEAEKGTFLIKSQLEDILKKRGLEQIAVKTGEEFNPEKHESVGEKESAEPPGTVAEVIQKGYLLNGEVLRPARVKLAKGQSIT